MDKKTYFISYTSRTEANKKRAIWTEWFFREKLNAETIMQEYDFHPGEDFKAKMDEALKKSDCVVCVLTREYLDSVNCREEWTNAEKFILIKFDDCEPKGLLKSRIYINLYNLDQNAARQKLLEELSEKVRPKDEPDFPGFVKEPEYPVAQAFPKKQFTGSQWTLHRAGRRDGAHKHGAERTLHHTYHRTGRVRKNANCG